MFGVLIVENRAMLPNMLPTPALSGHCGKGRTMGRRRLLLDDRSVAEGAVSKTCENSYEFSECKNNAKGR